MNFTFGIITADHTNDNYRRVVQSIKQNVDGEHEILTVGGPGLLTSVYRYQQEGIHISNTRIPFDCNKHPGWITKQKNIITENAKYENIVYLHDYVSIPEGWYEGMVEFGDDWDVCMTRVENLDGTRFRDWCMWGVEEGHHPHANIINEPWCQGIVSYGYPVIAPYDLTSEPPRLFYVSGAYWIAKKTVMQDNPLDEELKWGQGEDVEWSLRTLPSVKYVMNINSSVKLLKQKDIALRNYDQVYNF